MCFHLNILRVSSVKTQLILLSIINVATCFDSQSHHHLLLPLALQPAVGFGLSNNVLPFFPICHQFSPSSHSQDVKISFYFLFPSFPVSSPSSRSSAIHRLIQVNFFFPEMWKYIVQPDRSHMTIWRRSISCWVH